MTRPYLPNELLLMIADRASFDTLLTLRLTSKIFHTTAINRRHFDCIRIALDPGSLQTEIDICYTSPLDTWENPLCFAGIGPLTKFSLRGNHSNWLIQIG